MRCSKELIKQKNIIIKNLKKYFKNNQFKNVVIGISGGIDSAVSLAILTEVFDSRNIYAYFIDINSSKSDYIDAKLVCNYLKVKLNYVNLNKIYKKFIKITKTKSIIAQGNIKSRLRMIYLYDCSYNHEALVCGNSNLDELYLGYFTKYGDNACDFFLLNNFNKQEIKQLANYYKIPINIITKNPSAGLYINQTDEQELDLKYDEIDRFLTNKSINKKNYEKIKLLHHQNKHKLFYNYDINKWDKNKQIWKKEK